MKSLKIMFSAAMLLLGNVVLYAQSVTISGKVSDETGAPLTGAVVIVEGTAAGAMTNGDGAFSFTMNKAGSYTAVATFIGYARTTQPFEIGSSERVTVNFTLKQDAIELSGVVVTGVTNPVSKLESSISISTMNTKAMEQTGFRTTAEIFRSIPGIRSEASGGEGNTNITVRGVPISSGGSKYLQLQEDGLPVLLFGDIAFGTADIFLRADQSVGRIEAIRGGSASTMTSNGPAGIINFISKTGAVAGGSVGTSMGLDYNSYRTDISVGAPIGDNMSFHVGGFLRQGEGVRTTGFTGNNGGQIKANLTKNFDKGYVRLYYKMLNDRAAAYMPMPLQVSGTNADPTWGGVAGYDPQHGAMQTPNLMQDVSLSNAGGLQRINVSDGMHPVSQSVGGEFSFDLGDGWKIENRSRLSFNSGNFIAPFPAEIGKTKGMITDALWATISGQVDADYIQEQGWGGRALTATESAAVAANNATVRATQFAGKEGYSAKYAHTDSTFKDSILMRNHMFNTQLQNFNNFVNDVKVSKQLFGKLNLTAGLFRAQQNINMSWTWNTYLQEVKGENAGLVNYSAPAPSYDPATNTVGFASSSTAYTQNGLSAYGVPAWGNCCQRNYNTEYAVTAPYAAAEIKLTDDLNLSGSMRWDGGRVRGSYAGAVQTIFDMNNNGTIDANEKSVSAINNAAAAPVNYKYNYTSYSFGANYKLDENSAVFARYSKGASAKADRILFTNSVFADGSAKATLDFVNQGEVGFKRMFSKGGLFLTGFYAKTNEQGGYEATTQNLIENDYTAFGVELEGAVNLGDLTIRGGATYTNAKINTITEDIFRPRRQAPFIMNVNATYTYKKSNIGVNVFSTAKSFASDANQLVMPGYTVVNPYISVRLAEGFMATLGMNNAFNALGITESEEGSITENKTNIVRARPILGRSTNLSLSYNF